jgi:hypothetical protein
MVIRAIGDQGNPSIHNIPSDSDQRIFMDVGVNASGDFYLTLRDSVRDLRIEFESRGVRGGSQNRHFGPVFANFARSIFERAKGELKWNGGKLF